MAKYPDTLTDSDFPAHYRSSISQIDGKDVPQQSQRYDIRRASEELVASRTGSQRNNYRATSKVASLSAKFVTGDCAVYVMCPTSSTASKIGVARNPLARLKVLQTGCHEQLHIRHLFWLPEKQAYGLEGLSLRVIGKMGLRLVGEWVDMDPADLACLIATVVCSNESMQLADSEMFVNNLKGLLARNEEFIDSVAHQWGATPETILLNKA